MTRLITALLIGWLILAPVSWYGMGATVATADDGGGRWTGELDGQEVLSFDA